MDRNERHQSFYFISLIIGLILMMMEIGIYQITIIPFKVPFSLTLMVAVISFFVIRRDYQHTYQNKSNFFPFAQSFISFGFMACYLFMAANYYLADDNTEIKAIPILTKHTMGTGSYRTPAIEIDYEGTEKQLVFSSDQKDQLDTSQEVLVTVKKGFFGFDVFSDVQLK